MEEQPNKKQKIVEEEFKDVMLDIETLSTDADAVILTIGAIKFRRRTLIPKPSSIPSEQIFYRRITIESCEKYGLRRNLETEKWWSKQRVEARREALGKDRVDLKDALEDFIKWFSGCKYIWSHGDDFDTVILGTAFKKCQLKVPWEFWNTRDTRTLFDISGINNRDLPESNKHHALYDCHRQIVGINRSYDILFR